MCTGQRKLLKEVMVMQQYQQMLFLVNVPKQHLIMQVMVKKMLHNMLSNSYIYQCCCK